MTLYLLESPQCVSRQFLTYIMESPEHRTREASDPCIGMLCEVCTAAISSIRDSQPGFFEGPEPRLFTYAERPDTWRGAHHTEDGTFVAAVERRCYVCYTLHQACSTEARKHAEYFRTFYEICPEKHKRYLLQVAIEMHQDGLVTGTDGRLYEPYGNFKILPKKGM